MADGAPMARLPLAVALVFTVVVTGCTCNEDRIRVVPPPEEMVDAGPPPNPELCNGVDDDADGEIDEGFEPVVCGEGACRREMPGCTNGAVTECMPFSPTAETCNGIDDDCDGTVDEELMPQRCGVMEGLLSLLERRKGHDRHDLCRDPPPAHRPSTADRQA